MTYTSFGFYLFLPLVLVLYYSFPLRRRWTVLLAGSVCFYFLAFRTGWQLVLATILFSYGAGLLLERLRLREEAGEGTGRLTRLVFVLSVGAVFLPWVLARSGEGWFRETPHLSRLSLLTTLGMSFYTLQIVSYLTDIRRGGIRAQTHPGKYALFVLFFPQIVQGPIPRYRQLGGQLYEGHRFEEEPFLHGCWKILWGFFLKLVIADKAAVLVDAVFASPYVYQGAYVWAAGSLYTVQLYADFLACTVIAQGIALLFGIRLRDNFHHPYLSQSIQEFWRRWHQSLSEWLRDYIYIPLGGSRRGKAVRYRNLLLTFLASGIWHGFGGNFLLWGLWHALCQIAGDGTKAGKEKIYAALALPSGSRIRKALKRLGVFLLVMPGWVLFRAESLQMGLQMLKSMATVYNPWVFLDGSLLTLGLDGKDWLVLTCAIALLYLVSFLQESGYSAFRLIADRRTVVRWGVCLLFLCGILLFGTYGYGFEAQDFIYGGF